MSLDLIWSVHMVLNSLFLQISYFPIRQRPPYQFIRITTACSTLDWLWLFSQVLVLAQWLGPKLVLYACCLRGPLNPCDRCASLNIFHTDQDFLYSSGLQILFSLCETFSGPLPGSHWLRKLATCFISHHSLYLLVQSVSVLIVHYYFFAL